MTHYDERFDVHTPTWVFQTWASFAVAVGTTAAGLGAQLRQVRMGRRAGSRAGAPASGRGRGHGEARGDVGRVSKGRTHAA